MINLRNSDENLKNQHLFFDGSVSSTILYYNSRA